MKNLTAIGILITVVFAVTVILFSACEMEPKEPADNIIPKWVDEKGIRYYGGKYPKAMRQDKYYLLKSEEDRDKFIELFRTNFIEEYTEEYKDSPELLRAYLDSLEKSIGTYLSLNQYTNEFFNNFNLIIIPRCTSRKTNQVKAEKFVVNDNVLYIRIAIISSRDPSPCIDAPQGILIPVKKDGFNGENIEVEFRETTTNKRRI